VAEVTWPCHITSRTGNRDMLHGDSIQSPLQPCIPTFGYLGDSPNSEAVLEGTYVPPPETNYYGALLRGHMNYPPGMDNSKCLPDKVTTTDHEGNWKRPKEYTSAGLSGLHFGMFKSAAKHSDLVQFDAARRSTYHVQYWPSIPTMVQGH
jgi:hypothetical protein